MVKVLVLGATGYIGFPLCQSLRHDAHTIYGLARSAEKARTLAQQEIIPILGTVEGGEYLDTVRSANIDIVIDAAGANEGSYKVLKGLKEISAERLSQRGSHGPRLGFVYLGGTWVHGSSTALVNDLNPAGISDDAGCPTDPPALVAWRPKLERAILDSKDVLDSVIVRPALLYGGPSSLWSLWFDPILQEVSKSNNSDVHLLADANARPGLVHVDDVVSAIHLVVAKHSLVSTASGNYPVFDIVSSSELLKPMLDEAAKCLGFNGSLIYGGQGDNSFAEAMNTSMKGSSTRLRDLLGWVPKHTSMGEDIEQYTATWKAYH